MTPTTITLLLCLAFAVTAWRIVRVWRALDAEERRRRWLGHQTTEGAPATLDGIDAGR